MKLLAHTGFEFGKVWAGGNQIISSLSVVKSYVKAASKNALEIKGNERAAELQKNEVNLSLSTSGPSLDSSVKQGARLNLFSPSSTHLYANFSVSAGFEIAQAAWNANTVSVDAANADVDFSLKFVSGGNTYTLIWDSEGLRLFDIAGGVFLTPTNDNASIGNNKTNFSRFYHAQVWVDGSNNINVRAVAKDAPTEIRHWNITGTFTAPSDIEISSPDNDVATIDDLTIYEIENSNDFPAQDATTNDFQPALREVSVIAKSGTPNVRFYDPDSPNDWTASTNGVESDLSDGSDTTFAEVGLDRVGWEQHLPDGSGGKLTIDQIPLLDSQGNTVTWGAIHMVALHHWRVGDDDGENFTGEAEASSAIKQDGTQHLLQTPQTKTLQGVINQAGMLTANWDFSGLTGSDGVPIDETALTDLKMSIKKA